MTCKNMQVLRIVPYFRFYIFVNKEGFLPIKKEYSSKPRRVDITTKRLSEVE